MAERGSQFCQLLFDWFYLSAPSAVKPRRRGFKNVRTVALIDLAARPSPRGMRSDIRARVARRHHPTLVIQRDATDLIQRYAAARIAASA